MSSTFPASTVIAAGGDILLCGATRVEVGRQPVTESIAFLVAAGADRDEAEAEVEATIDALADTEGLRALGDGLVADNAGGVWHPSEAACAAIRAAGVYTNP